MNKEKIKLSKLSKIATIIGISISSFGLLLYITPYLFKDSINSGIKEVAKSYVKTDVQFKDIDISFKDDTDAYDLPDIETYKCPYKKHKDELLTDVAKTDPEYLEWLHENVNMREPMKTFVNELLKNKTN